MTRRSQIARWTVLALLLALVALPARGVEKQGKAELRGLSRFSQSVATRYWIAHPDQAPEGLRGRFEAAHAAAASGRRASGTAGSVLGDRFNRDVTGLPQNEESITACRNRPNVVLGGTNDYRGLLDPLGNSTGWHLSLNGGSSVTKEGLLPPVQIGGADVPSGGDPVDVAGPDCHLYAGNLNYDPEDPFHRPNGIGVYRTTPATLAACPGGGADPSCWPTRRAVAVAAPGHFLDKEWVHVGRSGSAGTVVWATWSDFTVNDQAPLGYTRAEIFATRCTANLATCTNPIPISVDDQDVQFSDVTVGPDGRTYITWAQIRGELEQAAQTFVIKLRVAQPGSTVFGPERVVYTERLPIPFGGLLHANDFRIATYPKHDVRMVAGKPRVYVVWDACRARPLDTVCEESVVKLRYSSNLGASWSGVRRLSPGVGEHYFPTISSDRAGGHLAVAWFTNRFDPIFHNRQDVELVTLDPAGAPVRRQRLTSPSNEPEADPLLGGVFIGDYIEVFAHRGTALVHYNANYTWMRLLGQGFPVPQQDNYLSVRGL